MDRQSKSRLNKTQDGLSPMDRSSRPRPMGRRSNIIKETRKEINPVIQPIEQPQSQFFLPAVRPGETTRARLAGGKYCLGTESTVPYVSLEGSGISQKVISWGEMVEVPKEQMVTIKNESFHQGDIAINSGWDYATRPGKITVPFQLLADGTIIDPLAIPAFPFTATPEFPLDCRLAKRAYVVAILNTDADDLLFTVIGQAKKHSFPVNAVFNFYTNIVTLPAFSAIEPIPLGSALQVTPAAALPMALTDTAEFTVDITDAALFSPIWFYVVEYT